MMPRIIFFGTPQFAIPCLDALVKKGFNVVGVVTQPDKPVGRGLKMEASPIKNQAHELNLNILNINNLPPADLGIVVAYGKIIPRKNLDAFPRGVLNIHPSLLPKYRGPSPVQTAILNGDKETGVTIMLLDDKVDHGPILAQHIVPISPLRLRGDQGGLRNTGGELLQKLMEKGADLLIKILPKYLNNEIAPQEQDHDKATFTKMLTREDGKIDWDKPAKYIERLVRAYDPWPGAWTIYQGKPAPIRSDKLQSGMRLKILKVSVVPLLAKEGSGVVGLQSNGKELVAHCNPGLLLLEQVQPEGKKPMSGQEFLRGYPIVSSKIL